MTKTETFLRQLQQESVTTRKMLSVVPISQLDWQPHPKSMTLRRLAAHVAELPGWIAITLHTDGRDLAKESNPIPPIDSEAALLDFFEQELNAGVKALQEAKDEDLLPNWTMTRNGQVINIRSKEEVIRMCISQIIHHRAQLGVFLRLLDVPIPGSYGPSADEMRR